MKLLHFGFFDDLPLEQRRDAVHRLCSETQRHPDTEKSMNYLRAGVPFMLIAGVTRDWLSEDQKVIGPPHVLTDGKWSWTADVSYYLERYGLSLPEDFVTHMKSNDWKVPKVIDLLGLEL